MVIWAILAMMTLFYGQMITNQIMSPLYLYGDPPTMYVQRVSEEPVFADLKKLCPGNPHPPRELLSHSEIQKVMEFWHRFQCPPTPTKTTLQKVPEEYKHTCKVASLGQYLLHAAHRANKSLLTVQVGAMDGTTNDPMYATFVPDHQHYQRYLWTLQRQNAAHHWLPVLFEPVPSNYEKLTQHYSQLAEKHKICSKPVNAAVNFEPGGDGKCAFCQYNTREDAPEQCKKAADWMKYQIGTLNCEHSKMFHNKKFDLFDLCILQDPLPCGVLSDMLKQEAGLDAHTAPLAILQIDIEGYEYKLLQNYLTTEGVQLPHAIHYEWKVMNELSRTMPLKGTQTRNQIVENLLRARGYVLWQEGEDVLALRLNEGIV